MPRAGETVFVDRLRGEVKFDNAQIDDQVLLKSDGFPTYHLANVVDDHLMGITHVIRAEEWISSTPKHVLLYQAFGWQAPEWVHMPLLRNADKSKISKRKNPVSIDYYRDAGFLPEALLNFLGMMGWSIGGDREKFTLDEMVAAFTFDRVSLGGPVFDLVKLSAMNAGYLRALSDAELVQRLRAWRFGDDKLASLVPLVRERIQRLDEFIPMTDFFFAGDVDYAPVAKELHPQGEGRQGRGRRARRLQRGAGHRARLLDGGPRGAGPCVLRKNRVVDQGALHAPPHRRHREEGDTAAVRDAGRSRARAGAQARSTVRRVHQEAAATETISVGDPSIGDLRAGDPFGVYVHFPFCSVRCPYCDFAVDTRADVPHDEYADAVIAELAARAGWFAGVGPLVSIYFGGGTPGLWRPDALGRVTGAIAAAFGGTPDREITIEVNPGEVDEARLAGFRAAGANRLSIGVQSLDDRALTVLGRNHGAAAGPACVRAARAAGFDNLSVDLICGVPGQSTDDWQRDVDAVIALAPEHVSAYALTVERGTAFGARDRAGKLLRPDDEAVAAELTHARAAFAAAGLEQYEISSYARPGRRARHNQLYWTLAPYLGLGASAASFRPLADGTGWRFSNPRATDVYLTQVRAAGASTPRHVERRSAADLENEALWLGLRTADGVERAAHRARHGVDPVAAREKEVAAAVTSGWLIVDDRALRLTPDGALFADENRDPALALTGLRLADFR